MKRLFILRHGDDVGGELTAEGMQRIDRVAKVITERTGSLPSVILSSTTKRAMHSAGLIADILKADIHARDTFVSGSGIREDLPAAFALMREQAAHDVVVVVTHYEYTERLPRYVERELLGTETFPTSALKKGRAWDIDLEKRTCTQIDV